MAIQFLLLINRQGKVRLTKWYGLYSMKERGRIVREVSALVLNRAPRMCNFLEWRDQRVVYKRYASLYFVACIQDVDNELLTLEVIHQFVEVLDMYFGSVSELDIIFNFHKAYFLLDEMMLCGEVSEHSKKAVINSCAVQDDMAEESLEKTTKKKR